MRRRIVFLVPATLVLVVVGLIVGINIVLATDLTLEQSRKWVTASLTGFEWAVGVPGSVGGAVRMNAGGHGSDMAACLVEARPLHEVRAPVFEQQTGDILISFQTLRMQRQTHGSL